MQYVHKIFLWWTFKYFHEPVYVTATNINFNSFYFFECSYYTMKELMFDIFFLLLIYIFLPIIFSPIINSRSKRVTLQCYLITRTVWCIASDSNSERNFLTKTTPMATRRLHETRYRLKFHRLSSQFFIWGYFTVVPTVIYPSSTAVTPWRAGSSPLLAAVRRWEDLLSKLGDFLTLHADFPVSWLVTAKSDVSLCSPATGSDSSKSTELSSPRVESTGKMAVRIF